MMTNQKIEYANKASETSPAAVYTLNQISTSAWRLR